VDGQGQALYLDEIHFVRIQTAVQEQLGWLGEVSTEFRHRRFAYLIQIWKTTHIELQF
jgi:hypothetical protein